MKDRHGLPAEPDADVFIESYLATFADVIRDISSKQITAANAVLLDAFDRGSWVFVAGNGGSAAAASHFACDLEKTVSGKKPRETRKRFRVMSLVDNVSTLTAWANDETYECVFSEPLRTHAQRGDVLVVITASGNSPNVVDAIEAAREMGVTTIGWLGFDGGKALQLCDYPIHVPVEDYGIVEGAHGVVAHLMTAWLTHAVSRFQPQLVGETA